MCRGGRAGNRRRDTANEPAPLPSFAFALPAQGREQDLTPGVYQAARVPPAAAPRIPLPAGGSPACSASDPSPGTQLCPGTNQAASERGRFPPPWGPSGAAACLRSSAAPRDAGHATGTAPSRFRWQLVISTSPCRFERLILACRLELICYANCFTNNKLP